MNEGLGQREDERVAFKGLVVEAGQTRGRNGAPDEPYTVFYVGRWIENLVLRRNGFGQGEVVDMTGVLVDTSVTYPKGGRRRVQFIKDAEVATAGGSSK